MRDLTRDPGCADARDALPDLLHGRLAGETRAAVERHVASCGACAAEFALLRDARAAVRAGAPAVDVAAIAAAVRAATVPAAAPRQVPRLVPSAPGRAVTPPGVAAPSRWRAGRPVRALAATVLVAVGAGAAWLGRGALDPGAGRVADSALADAGVPRGGASPPGSTPAPVGSRQPALLASADAAAPVLGARFDDLTDDELQAVIAAVEGSDRTLPSEEVAPAEPDVSGEG